MIMGYQHDSGYRVAQEPTSGSSVKRRGADKRSYLYSKEMVKLTAVVNTHHSPPNQSPDSSPAHLLPDEPDKGLLRLLGSDMAVVVGSGVTQRVFDWLSKGYHCLMGWFV